MSYIFMQQHGLHIQRILQKKDLANIVSVISGISPVKSKIVSSPAVYQAYQYIANTLSLDQDADHYKAALPELRLHETCKVVCQLC